MILEISTSNNCTYDDNDYNRKGNNNAINNWANKMHVEEGPSPCYS